MKKTRVVMSTALSAVLLGTTALPAYAGAQAQGEILLELARKQCKRQQRTGQVIGLEAVVNKWKSAGRISGYPDGSFRPDQRVTRSEFVTVLNKIFGFMFPIRMEPLRMCKPASGMLPIFPSPGKRDIILATLIRQPDPIRDQS